MGRIAKTVGTIRLDDMRLFAAIAELGSFTAAARSLGIPKQTLSRRVAELEAALGVRLLHRTTRRLRPTEAGAAYARRCAEVVKLADDASRAVREAGDAPRGTLRITADPVLGEAFVGAVVLEHLRRFPDVRVDLVLTRRRVDLIEEGFDLAFRIGQVGDASLAGIALGPAEVRYCASPAYVARHGAPTRPAELARHACLLVASDDAVVRWPFRSARGKAPALVAVDGPLRSTSFAVAADAARAGLGIAIFPEFACRDDLRAGRLVSVLDAWRIGVGQVWLLHAARPYVTARVRSFVELARARFADAGPWSPTRAQRAVTRSIAGR